MPKQLARRWRGDFLRALARTGNVRASARAAGVDPGTAYNHRGSDVRFAVRWEEALAKARERGPLHRATRGPPPRSGEELIARRFAGRGTQLVKAAPGRWGARTRAAFLAELRRTGSVRAGSRACGLSTTTLYNRRKHYPDFARDWAEAEAAARERVPALLTAATIASLDPEIEDQDLPKVDVDQAIAICRLKGFGGGAGAATAGRGVPEAPPIEAVRASILARLDAIEAHEARKSGEGE